MPDGNGNSTPLEVLTTRALLELNEKFEKQQSAFSRDKLAVWALGAVVGLLAWIGQDVKDTVESNSRMIAVWEQPMEDYRQMERERLPAVEEQLNYLIRALPPQAKQRAGEPPTNGQ